MPYFQQLSRLNAKTGEMKVTVFPKQLRWSTLKVAEFSFSLVSPPYKREPRFLQQVGITSNDHYSSVAQAEKLVCCGPSEPRKRVEKTRHLSHFVIFWKFFSLVCPCEGFD